MMHAGVIHPSPPVVVWRDYKSAENPSKEQNVIPCFESLPLYPGRFRRRDQQDV
jgi:hypothetical protein